MYHDSDDAFKELARNNTKDLINLVSNDLLPPASMTFATEILGNESPKEFNEQIIEVLLKKLNDNSPLVREGAIYGLAPNLENPEVNSRLKDLLKTDPSPGVRDAIEDMFFLKST